MVNKKDDWHRERRIGKAVKAGIKCFCGSEAYRDILEVTMNCETFPRVHRIFCPNCGLQMRSPAGNDDDFIVRQWRDILKAQEPHWISVKDRLPVGVGTVLIAHKGGVSFGWFNGAYWTKGAATKHKPIKTVTHWMPLPEPPKEVDDNA